MYEGSGTPPHGMVCMLAPLVSLKITIFLRFFNVFHRKLQFSYGFSMVWVPQLNLAPTWTKLVSTWLQVGPTWLQLASTWCQHGQTWPPLASQPASNKKQQHKTTKIHNRNNTQLQKPLQNQQKATTKTNQHTQQ